MNVLPHQTTNLPVFVLALGDRGLYWKIAPEQVTIYAGTGADEGLVIWLHVLDDKQSPVISLQPHEQSVNPVHIGGGGARRVSE